jgi:raffinose/stachyose/melibiose transport system substrate-binding protein
MRNRWKGAAVAAALCVLLAGCSDPGAGGGTTAAGPAAWPEETARLDGVELTIWAAQNSTTVGEKVVADFEAATGASVEITTIPDPYEQGVQTRVATGDLPDLAFWQPTSSMLTALGAGNVLQPLDGAPWLERTDPALRDLTGLLDGTRYAALITSPAVEGVYYNKEVLAAAGITTPPRTFDEMVAAGRTLMAAGVTPFFEMGGDRWATQWWVQVQLADAARDGLWDRVNSGQEKFTDPTILGAIERYKALIDEGLFNADIATAAIEDQAAALLAGQAGMVVQVNSFFTQLQAIADTPELDQKIGFFPIGPSGNVGTFIPDQSNALVAFRTSDTAREAAARQLMSFWLGQGYPAFLADRQTVSLQPAVPDPDGVPTALRDVHAALPTSVGSMQALAVANPDLYIYLADMIQGTTTPQQVAEQTQAHFDQLAKAQGIPGF